MKVIRCVMVASMGLWARAASSLRSAAEAGVASAAPRLGSTMGPPFNPADWVLEWEDDFPGTSLNLTNWTPKTGTHVPSEGEWYDPAHVSVADGSLILRSDVLPQHGLNYTSGWVDSQSKQAFLFGRFEVRAKLPFGQGLWPAHWLMPQDGFCWPLGGEIDIMENLGQWMNVVHAAIHGSNSTAGNPCGQSEVSGGSWSPTFDFDFSADFHTFGLLWNATRMDFYVDNTTYYTFHEPQSLFVQRPFYWILNTAVGGSWGGFPNASTVFPQFHTIDSVRVFNPVDGQWK